MWLSAAQVYWLLHVLDFSGGWTSRRRHHKERTHSYSWGISFFVFLLSPKFLHSFFKIYIGPYQAPFRRVQRVRTKQTTENKKTDISCLHLVPPLPCSPLHWLSLHFLHDLTRSDTYGVFLFFCPFSERLSTPLCTLLWSVRPRPPPTHKQPMNIC